MSGAALQQQHSHEAEALRAIGKDLQKNYHARNTFMTQQGENEMVMRELELLEEDAAVYKMIGPVLVKQDLVEAKANVGKRLEYIKGELGRLDIALKSLRKKQSDKQAQLQKMQERMKDMTHAAGSAN
eukprot:jgi/Tetstr1/432799/TSEL_022151.t1